MNIKYDFFISHASIDKPKYIQPLAECLTKRKVTYWLDSDKIQWGDSLTLKVNNGLRDSQYVILCLSEYFLSRSWTETELNSAFAINQGDINGKVLPLILNNKKRILKEYPLIAGLVYREFSSPEQIADELASLVNSYSISDGHIKIAIESIHTGNFSSISVPPRASVEWLLDKAKKSCGLIDSLDTGGFQMFSIRWVLVDANLMAEWKTMNKRDRQEVYAIVKTKKKGIQVVTDKHQRLFDIGVQEDMVFHLVAVEDIDNNEDEEGGVFHYKL